MTSRLTVVTAVLAVLCATAVRAEEKKGAPPMPAPAPEMKNLAAFEGDWSCDGSMPPGPMGPGGKMKSTVAAKTGLGGFWQLGTVRSEMTGMPAMEGRFHMTYDPAGKQYVMLWIDNMGAWSKTTSPGWTGDTIVFSGESMMNGQTMMGRDTFQKTADGALKHTGEMQMEGKWVSMMEETCRHPAKK